MIIGSIESPARDIPCPACPRKFRGTEALEQHRRAKHGGRSAAKRQGAKKRKALSPGPSLDANWGGACETCGASPVVPETGMCGPCTFGEAETAGGNW